jgi:hypothetical protein
VHSVLCSKERKVCFTWLDGETTAAIANLGHICQKDGTGQDSCSGSFFRIKAGNFQGSGRQNRGSLGRDIAEGLPLLR